MDGLASWLMEKKDEVEARDLVAFLLASATLNYKAQRSEALFEVR